MVRLKGGGGKGANWHRRPDLVRAVGALVLTLCMGLLLTPSAGAASHPLANVRFIDHGLTVWPPKAKPGRGRVRQPLYAAYGLSTGSHQRASIGFVDKTVLHINQRTDLVLRSPGLTMVRKGEVAALGNPGDHERIVTSTAAVSALGTEFDLRIERAATSYSTGPRFPPGTTTVSVVAGIVAVSNRYGRVQVTAGHWTHVAPGKAPTKPTKHNARHDVAWTAGLPGP